ncbi:C47 family peptidase [Enterococcus sp. AZ192]|uniref:C47 family peptidase n=1 Tax=unclassified Enterococcus TaxID=2608891 RepID=UPI003D2E7F6E
MKKIILSMLLLFGAVSFQNVTANATEGADVIVQTESVSGEVDQFAKNDFGLALTSILFLESNNTNASDYSLGSAFSMFDGEKTEKGTVYYPVYLDEKLEFLYSVRKNELGEYVSSVTRFLVNEMNIAIDSANGEPISFFVKEDDIFYRVNDTIEKIFEAPRDEFSSKKSDTTELTIEDANEVLQSTENNIEEKNVSEQTDFVEQANISKGSKLTRSSVSTAKNYAMINWKINETQSDLPWCAGYVTAAILSNKVDARPTRAVDIANYSFPKLTAKQRENQGISPENVLAYANYRKTYPKWVENTVSHSVVESNLRKGNALYIGGIGYGDSNKSRHAFALYGWVDSENPNGGKPYRVYYIWNPWWNYPMTVQGNTLPMTIPVPGGGYTWYRTIYNF